MDRVDMTSSSSSGDAVSSCSDNGSFVSHKVNKLDTLAGLALRYNIPMSEIKRANGLLSDTAMYGRDTLLIPTKTTPVREEVAVIFAQIASGFGRDPVLNAEAATHPASSAAARVARTIQLANGDTIDFPPDVPADWCYCGLCLDSEERGGYLCRQRSFPGEPGDVELVERNLDDTMFTPPSTTGENMRRRRGTAEEGPQSGPSIPWRPPASQASRSGSGHGGSAAGHAAPASGGFLTLLSKAIGDSVQKIKQAANQPALATGGRSTGFLDAADGVLLSRQPQPQGAAQMRKVVSAGKMHGAGGALPPSFNASATPSKPHSSRAVKED